MNNHFLMSVDVVDQECEQNIEVACLLSHHLRLSVRASQMAWRTTCMPTCRDKMALEYCGLQHPCVAQMSYSMLIRIPKNEHSKRTKQNPHGLWWPALGIHIASFHYGLLVKLVTTLSSFTSQHKSRLSLLGGESQQASGHFSKKAAQNHWGWN